MFGKFRLAAMQPTMMAALAISVATHAAVAVLLRPLRPADPTAPETPLPTLHVRMVPVEEPVAERRVSQAAAKQILASDGVQVTPSHPESDKSRPSIAPGSALPDDIAESTALAAGAASSPVRPDLHPLTFAPLEPTVVVSQQELDAQPIPIDPVIPVFPSTELAASTGGLIKLQLLIDEVGRVTSVDVIESGLPEAFGVSATRAFEAARFQPGLRNGLPVRCRVITSIQFAATALAPLTSTPRDAQSGLRE